MQQTSYIIEPLILSMQQVFQEYSNFFQNDLPLQVMNRICVLNNKNIIKNNLDNLLHNQEEKLKLYNYLFYKLLVSEKKYSLRIMEIKNIISMIIWFETLYNGMSVCSYEEYIFNKNITPKLKREKLKSFICIKPGKTINFKLFGYSTKTPMRFRIYVLNEAISFYGIDNVFQCLKKIQNFNECFKQDYIYILNKYHLFPKNIKIEKQKVFFSTKKENYENVIDGIKPSIKDNEVVIGTLCLENYDIISQKTSFYFKNFQKKELEEENIKNKIKKIYPYLTERITY